MRYPDDTTMRPATDRETLESIVAAYDDGGHGVIEVDGQSCYVIGYDYWPASVIRVDFSGVTGEDWRYRWWTSDGRTESGTIPGCRSAYEAEAYVSAHLPFDRAAIREMPSI